MVPNSQKTKFWCLKWYRDPLIWICEMYEYQNEVKCVWGPKSSDSLHKTRLGFMQTTFPTYWALLLSWPIDYKFCWKNPIFWEVAWFFDINFAKLQFECPKKELFSIFVPYFYNKISFSELFPQILRGGCVISRKLIGRILIFCCYSIRPSSRI